MHYALDNESRQFLSRLARAVALIFIPILAWVINNRLLVLVYENMSGTFGATLFFLLSIIGAVFLIAIIAGVPLGLEVTFFALMKRMAPPRLLAA